MQIMEFKYWWPEAPRLIHPDQFKQRIWGPEWIAEPKLNGTRLQLHKVNGLWQFWGRHGDPLKYQPSSSILMALNTLSLNGYWLFDGELRHHKTVGIKNKIAFFDVFVAEGELLIGIPFGERRKILEKIFRIEADPVGLVRQYPFGFVELFDRLTREPEVEGLVMKNRGGRLNLGRTREEISAWMLKVRKPSGRYHF
jgi:ATP-dependent DNA ligase